MTSLLPPNATALERAAEALADLRLADLDTPFRALWSAQDCPEELLPWLAWALSIDQWDAGWPLHVRRARVAGAIAVQRRKGTLRSVQDVIASFGGSVALREWWQQAPPADPHTFTLTVSLTGFGGDAPPASYVDAVIAEVTATKPLRAHFDFVLALTAMARVGLRGAGRAAVSARVRASAQPWDVPSNAMLFAGQPLTLGGDLLLIGT